MKLKTKTSVCYVMPHIKASLSFLSLRSWQGRHIWLVFLYLFFFITRCLLHATFICWRLFYWYFYAQACWLCPPFQVKCPQVLLAQMWGRYEPKTLSRENTNNKVSQIFKRSTTDIHPTHFFNEMLYITRSKTSDLLNEGNFQRLTERKRITKLILLIKSV